MTDAHRGYARTVQSEVYRAGVSGTKPAVPVDGEALERAARKATSAEAFAYLAGGAGAEATMAANGRRSRGGRSGRGCSATSPSATSRSSCWVAAGPRRSCSRRSGSPSSRTPTPTSRWAARHPPSTCPTCCRTRRRRPMEEVGRRDGRRLAVVPAVLERVRRAERLAAAACGGGRLRGGGRHARHAPARLAHARPRRRVPALHARAGHRAVHERSRVRRSSCATASRGAGRRRRAAEGHAHAARLGAAHRPRRRRHAARRGRRARRAALAAPEGGGRDVPRRVLRPEPHVGRPRPDPRVDRPARAAQGHRASG